MKRTSTQENLTRLEKTYHDHLVGQLAAAPTPRSTQTQSACAAPCPLVHALNIIGGKWKLAILWKLYGKETVRYNELRRAVGDVTNMMLSKCLKELEAEGLVSRTQYPEMPPRVEYALTERSRALIPALDALYKWGEEQLAQTKG